MHGYKLNAFFRSPELPEVWSKLTYSSANSQISSEH